MSVHHAGSPGLEDDTDVTNAASCATAPNPAIAPWLQSTRLAGRVAIIGSLIGIMRMHSTFIAFFVVVFFAANAAGRDSAPSASPTTGTEIVAPCEYRWGFDWTFSYGRGRYGLEQYGPVAVYPRNTLVIWHSRAHRIPVTVPWAVFIAACVVIALFGFAALLFQRSKREVKVVDAS